MLRRVSFSLAAVALLVTTFTLFVPRTALAGAYWGPQVQCNGSCQGPGENCIPRNTGPYPIMCNDNGTCPVGGLSCRPSYVCAVYATWDCQCYSSSTGFGAPCSAY
jgi:hypothetical protein